MKMKKYMEQALTIIGEWNAKTDKEQINFCTNCVRKAIRQGRKLGHGDELDDAINTVYVKVVETMLDADALAKKIERRASQGYDDSLAGIISRAAKAELQREMDEDKRDGRMIISDTATDADGQEYSLIDSIASSADTEKASTIQSVLKDFYNGLDERNKTIFKGMVKGKTEREIAADIGISHVATHNRITRIRTGLATML